MSRRIRSNHSKFSLFAFQDIITCVMGIMLLLTLLICLQITTVTVTSVQSSGRKSLDELKEQAAELAAEVAAVELAVNEQSELIESGAIQDSRLLLERATSLQKNNTAAREDVRTLWEQQAADAAMLQQLEREAAARRDQPQQTVELKQSNATLKKKIETLRRGDRLVYNAHTETSKTCWLVEMSNNATFLAAEMGKKQPPQQFGSRQALVSWIRQRHQSGAVFMLVVKPGSADALEKISEDLRRDNITFGFDLLPQHQAVLDPVTGAAL